MKDIEEQALEKAIAKLKEAPLGSSLWKNGSYFEVCFNKPKEGVHIFKFPFQTLKHGDICICDLNEDTVVGFWNEKIKLFCRYLSSIETENGIENTELKFKANTGTNYFEIMKGVESDE